MIVDDQTGVLLGYRDGPGVCVFKGSSSTWALRTAL